MANDAQWRRLFDAFGSGGCLTAVDCDCGRTHFVSGGNCGDYAEGELEKYQQLANDPKGPKAKDGSPSYIEHVTDNLGTVWIDGRYYVEDCPCEGAIRYAYWLEANALAAARYLTDFLKAEHEKTLQEAAVLREAAQKLDDALAPGDGLGGLEE